MDVLHHVVMTPWLCWGLMPGLSAAVGYLMVGLAFECVLHYSLIGSDSLITYGAKPRRPALDKTREKVSLSVQFKVALMNIFGRSFVINSIFSWLLFSNLVGTPADALPALTEFLVQLGVMLVINDFALYWGHRIQHESEYLWKNFHSKHHELDTPTPFSTLYIADEDATLQGALPILLAGVVVRPHPVTLWTFIFCRVAENVSNHSGIDTWWFNLMTLKALPLRASVRHHDSHHKYSNYSKNAKNYGESFWVWDYLFGTHRAVQATNAAKQT
mmetsp:Transcript_30462/g.59525  ORF Transcript_30462/g.59525 Transcript_30462/m.59525 type:complete len:273 (+) Transcript_30462:13-831(+)